MRDLFDIDSKIAEIPDSIGIFPLTISILHEQDFITIKVIYNAVPCIG